eukprot:Ihof_evm2s345 gene=Ihof_evmTU2s345
MEATMPIVDSEVRTLIKNLAEDPTVFITRSEDLSKQMLDLTKRLFDYAVESSPNPDSLGPLSELLTDGFDNDQIWEELELQNVPALSSLEKKISQLTLSCKETPFTIIPEKKPKATHGKRKSKRTPVQPLEEEEEEEEIEDGRAQRKTKNDMDTTADVFDDLDLEEGEEGRSTRKKRRGKASKVDDRFFHLSEMQQFLDKMDREEMKEQNDNIDDDDSEAEETNEKVDLFDDPDELVESEDEDDDEVRVGSTLHYEDFFNPPSDDEAPQRRRRNKQTAQVPVRPVRESAEKTEIEKEQQEEDEDDEDVGYDGMPEEEVEEEEGLEEEEEEGEGEGEEEDDEEEEEDEQEEEEEEEGDVPVGGKAEGNNLLFSDDENEKDSGKSTFEKKQENMKRKIEELEEKNLKGREWTLMGEASVKSRPKDSLLEETLEFETTMKPAPAVTHEMTLTIEEMIRQRIKDEAWDDVERKSELPTSDWKPKRVDLDHEKSKQSLAEVYEGEYMKQVKGVVPVENEEINKEHEEITKIFKDLCHKLDALSNFHYTPALPKEEIEVVSNVPAIQMEEVLPMATSEHRQLAPEEVYANMKGDTVGDNEKTDTDKSRQRRQKKAHRRQKEQDKLQKQKAIQKANPGKVNLPSKKEATNIIAKGGMKGASMIEDGAVDTKSFKSSSAFFSKLQDEARQD